MVASFFAIAATFAFACFLYDLEHDRWDWPDKKRKLFLVVSGPTAVYASSICTWHPVLVRFAVALVAAFIFILVGRKLLERRSRSAIRPRRELNNDRAKMIASGIVIFIMLIQIAQF